MTAKSAGAVGIVPKRSKQEMQLHSNQRTPLKIVHGVLDPGEKRAPGQRNIDEYGQSPLRIDVLRKLNVEWIVRRRHSFNETEDKALRKIFEFIDPRSTKALVSDKTFDIQQYFERAKTSIIDNLSVAKSRIHISYDLWTSPNHKAMISIVAHWTNEQYKAQTALLAIREIHGEHTAVNISDVVYFVLKEYGIEDEFGYFVRDNAPNNNTSVKSLDRLMRNDEYEGFVSAERRLRWFAHEMQIAVKGLLFGPKAKELEDYPATAGVTDEEKREYARKKWRSFGAVGKLHNVIKFIRGSPQGREAYAIINQQPKKAAQNKLKVIMDIDTRWGSVMDRVENGLENRVHIRYVLSRYQRA